MVTLKEIRKKLSSGFFPFWINHWRVSVLIVILIIVLGSLSLYTIPKESNPEIEFGVITITTPYPGVNPVDVDTLVTDKIENAVDDIDGINTITSTSSVGVANTTIELKNDVDVTKALNEIKDEVDKVSLPEDAEDPIIREVSETQQSMFQLIIYGDEELFPKERLIQAASTIKNALEGVNGISEISIEGSDEFDLEVLVDKEKTQELGIGVSQITNAIRAHNRNVPLGQYEVDNLNYDFRIQGELASEEEIFNVPVLYQEYTTITIGDIARVVRSYENEGIKQLGTYQSIGNNAISLNFQKEEGFSIFSASDQTKNAIDRLMQRQQFAGIQYKYANDLSEIIRDDYNSLGKNGLITLIFVLLCLFIFVGFKEAIIATLGIILAFFVTFTVLDTIGLSLNFLTNFSLVLTLGIAIDTAIVVIEASYENLKLGYRPKTAILMAVRDFKAPLIAGTTTTIVVFIPMMVLPGIIGKFLAYIPTTVFITLLAALFIALTVNAALFYLFSKNKKQFITNEKAEKFLTDDDAKLLEDERTNKEPKDKEKVSKRQRLLERLNNRYEGRLDKYIHSRTTRQWSIIIPILLLIISLFLLSPMIGFSLFPSGDNNRFDITIEGQSGLIEEELFEWAPYIEPVLSDYQEIDHYILTVNDNTMNIGVELLTLDERNRRNLMGVFELQEKVLERLSFLEQEGLSLQSIALEGGPPQGKPVALKFIVDDNSRFNTLQETAKKAQNYMYGIEGLKNVDISSEDAPGQFVYTFREEALRTLGLTPSMVQGEISSALNGSNAGTIKYQYNDADIVVLYEQYSEDVSPTDIQELVINTQAGAVRVGDILNYSIENAVAQITREDGEVTITVDADLEDGFENSGARIQSQLTEWASQQTFPEGVRFEAGGEGQENQDLIQATVRGFFIAFFLIFGILLLQFNSYRKPVVILYSVFCALLGVNIGLFLTGNPYSMPFAIGFIALTGIVVNDAIVFVDRVNVNNKQGFDEIEAIVEAGRSRLQPIILTTLTTLLGVLPLALEDPFWAGLGFTIIFGLFAGSTMTLFIIPSLYYEIIVEKKLTWFKVIFWLIILLPYGIYLCIKRIRYGAKARSTV